MRSKTIIDNGSIPTLCRQCAQHCGIYAHVEEGRVTRISGNKSHPENLGMVCPKGRAAAQWVYHPDRLTGCLKRADSGRFEAIAYDQALDEIAGKMMEIKDSFGARAMSAWTGEAIGFLQQEAFARRFIHAFGSPNFFTADSVCFALRLMAYQTCQGYWSYPPDFERAGMTILWGSNPAYSHPSFMQRINKSRRRGGKLVVVDPRRSVAAKKADLFLQLRPGTDAALVLGLIRFLIHEKAYDRKFVASYSIGFEALAAYAEQFTTAYVAQQTGVSETVIDEMQHMMLQNLPRCVSFPGISLEHQVNGFNTIRAIACLTALCGAIDIEGGEPWNKDIRVNDLNPLNKEQFTAMNPAGYARYPLFYEVMQKCHSIPGIDYMLGKGHYPIKGLIFAGTNPELTNPNAKKVARAFAGLDLLVARDLFMTESAKLAHYVIPAASFLERSELHFYPDVQRVGLSQKVLEVQGTWDEYTFWHDLAHRLDFGDEYFPWENEAAVNRWLLEPSGVSLEALGSSPEGIAYDEKIEHRKYENGPFPTSSGKFEFISEGLKALDCPPCPSYEPPEYLTTATPGFPLRMISGSRKAIYYHSRFREIEKFKNTIPRAQAEMHADDAADLSIQDGDTVRIVSKIGEITIQTKVVQDHSILKGFVAVPHGWNMPNVNRLTDDRDADPVGGFPNLKIVPIRLERMKTNK
jgi:anaerobic selenocysteine-containing dehydrogenase